MSNLGNGKALRKRINMVNSIVCRVLFLERGYLVYVVLKIIYCAE